MLAVGAARRHTHLQPSQQRCQNIFSSTIPPHFQQPAGQKDLVLAYRFRHHLVFGPGDYPVHRLRTPRHHRPQDGRQVPFHPAHLVLLLSSQHL